jgi:hypothetical protein
VISYYYSTHNFKREARRVYTNNEQTKKESTSEKSGEREDGFEGRGRRTFGVVFEDSRRG